MIFVSDTARDSIKTVMASQHAKGKNLVLYLQGAS